MPARNRSQSTDLRASRFSQSAARLNVSRSNRRKAPAFPALLRWLCPRSPPVLCRLPPLMEKLGRAVSTNHGPLVDAKPDTPSGMADHEKIQIPFEVHPQE